MGKLREVLSRRILWFSRRRLKTGLTQASRQRRRTWCRTLVVGGAVVAGLSCSDEMNDPTAPNSAVIPSDVDGSFALSVTDYEETRDREVPVGGLVEVPTNLGELDEPVFWIEEAGDPTIADIALGPDGSHQGVIAPDGSNSVLVQGIGEGSTTWKVRGTYAFDPNIDTGYTTINVTVTAGDGGSVESLTMIVGDTHEMELGFEPMVTVVSGFEWTVSATPNASGVSFEAQEAGVVVFELEWTDANNEDQLRTVVITVLAEAVVPDTLRVEKDETRFVRAPSERAVTVEFVSGENGVANVTAASENGNYGVSVQGVRSGTADWRLSLNNQGSQSQHDMTVEVLSPPSSEQVRVQVGASADVFLGGDFQPSVSVISGERDIVTITNTSTGVSVLGVRDGEGVQRLTWDDAQSIGGISRVDLDILVSVPVDVPLDTVTVEVGDTHTQDVGYTPTVVTHRSGDAGAVSYEISGTTVIFTALAEGVASYRIAWEDEAGVISYQDVEITVPEPPLPPEDSPVLSVGDTLFWENDNILPRDIRWISGDEGAAYVRAWRGQRNIVGLWIEGLSEGTARYEVRSTLVHPSLGTATEVIRDLQVTVLPGLEGIALDMYDRTHFLNEGDTAHVRAYLREPATSSVTIPVTLTPQPIEGWVRKLAYDWTRNDKEADVRYKDAAQTSIVIAAGEQSGTVPIYVHDDDLTEPASSEVIRVELTVPSGVDLATHQSFTDIRIFEGVCDRTAALHQEFIDQARSRAWNGNKCEHLTDEAILSILQFYPNLSPEDDDDPLPHPNFKVGDFAGLARAQRFSVTGFDGTGSAWASSLFQDLNAVEVFGLYDWTLHTIPEEMFVGMNPDLTHVEMRMAETTDVGVNGMSVEAGAMTPFTKAVTAGFHRFHMTTLEPSFLADLKNLLSLRIQDWPHLTKIHKNAFASQTKVIQMRLRDLPNVGDKGVPKGMLANQRNSMTGMYMTGMGLQKERLHTVFGGVTPETALVGLDISNNEYESMRGVINPNTFPHLDELHLENNEIERLGKNDFNGLKLSTLHLMGNPGADFEITSKIQVKDDTMFRMHLDKTIPGPVSFRVYGSNLGAQEIGVRTVPGSNVSDYQSISRSDTEQQALLRASVGQIVPHDFNGLKIKENDNGGGEAVLHTERGGVGNRMPVVLRSFRNVNLWLSDTETIVAEWTADLTEYIRSDTDWGRSLSWVFNSSDTTVATVVTGQNDLGRASVTITAHAAGTSTIRWSTADTRSGNQQIGHHFTVSVNVLDNSRFNIQVLKVGRANREPVSSAADRAVEFWESVLLDAPNVLLTDSEARKINCRGVGLPNQQNLVDDIVIVIGAINIDGPGRRLASASLCVERDDSFGNQEALGIMGMLNVDVADLGYLQSEPDGLEGTIRHEIGHLMGIGSTWYEKAPVGTMSYDPPTRHHMASHNPFVYNIVPNDRMRGRDIAFLGSQAYEGWEEVGGSSEIFSLRGAPIATEGYTGSFGVHWSEEVMEHELMTPFKDFPAPFSTVTYNSLADLGWTLNPTFTSEDYRVPGAEPETASANVVPNPSADRPQPAIDLSNDVFWMPVTRIGRDGRVSGIHEPTPLNLPENQQMLDMIDEALSTVIEQLELDDPDRQ